MSQQAGDTGGDPGGQPQDIRASSVLPARRRELTLHTADGLRLVGALALPQDEPPAATLVCLHPLPTHGGSLDSHVLRKAAWRLPALAGLAVLRLNTRGTASQEGTSEGAFGDGEQERWDLAAALDVVEAEDLPHPWLVGWSFGSEVALKHGHEDPGVEGAVLLSPPLHRAGDADLDAWAASGKPLHLLVPEHDDYLQPPRARERFARVPQAVVTELPGSGHLFVGARHADAVLQEIVRAVLPEAVPLPRHWPPTGEERAAREQDGAR